MAWYNDNVRENGRFCMPYRAVSGKRPILSDRKIGIPDAALCFGAETMEIEINKKYAFQMPICGIYQITCKVNNKIYIGQSKNVIIRILEHLRNFIEQKNDSEIQYDYDRWGIEAFEWEILEKCNLVDLRELEKEYIAKYFGTARLYNQVIDRPYPEWFLQGKESP